MPLSQILAQDQQWLQEQQQAEQPLIGSVSDNDLSSWLRQKQADYGGLLSEVIVTDRHGLNIAASPVTTDYWQGDESKFSDPFFASQDRPYMSPLSYDQSTQRYLVHISQAVRNPSNGDVIGVIILGIDIELALKMEKSIFPGDESSP